MSDHPTPRIHFGPRPEPLPVTLGDAFWRQYVTAARRCGPDGLPAGIVMDGGRTLVVLTVHDSNMLCALIREEPRS